MCVVAEPYWGLGFDDGVVGVVQALLTQHVHHAAPRGVELPYNVQSRRDLLELGPFYRQQLQRRDRDEVRS